MFVACGHLLCYFCTFTSLCQLPKADMVMVSSAYLSTGGFLCIIDDLEMDSVCAPSSSCMHCASCMDVANCNHLPPSPSSRPRGHSAMQIFVHLPLSVRPRAVSHRVWSVTPSIAASLSKAPHTVSSWDVVFRRLG